MNKVAQQQQEQRLSGRRGKGRQLVLVALGIGKRMSFKFLVIKLHEQRVSPFPISPGLVSGEMCKNEVQMLISKCAREGRRFPAIS